MDLRLPAVQLKYSAAFVLAGVFYSALPANADYYTDVRFDALRSELGAGLANGAGVSVSQVEAATQVGPDQAWTPDPALSQFSGKTLIDMSGATTGIYSGHANNVGRRFFGNSSSTSPGISKVFNYLADHWLGSGTLRTSTGGGPVYQPMPANSRVGNHSWIGSLDTYNTDALSRLDWLIATDETIQTVGFTGSGANPLLSSAFNVIAVNKTSAPTASGSAGAGGIYTVGRTRPDIVAPDSTTSAATPRVASAAALLIDAAHSNPLWSADPVLTSTTNRNGDIIYNAERVEVIKSALMAGASRTTTNTSSTDITDYRADVADRTTNGLDRRFGAGQLDIYNSYHILAAGEQNSIEDHASSAGMIGAAGFDYDPNFGGANGTNSKATYFLATTAAPTRLSASLVWNLAIDGGTARRFDGSASLFDLNLKLFDVTNPDNWVLIGSSASAVDNTENLWLLLDGGKDYALQVERGPDQTPFRWDYGLAWHAGPVAPLAVDPIVLPEGKVNAAYPDQTLTATGGEGRYTWSIFSGALPQGLTLSSDGVINGTPTQTASVAFTVAVTDSAARLAMINLVLQVKTGNTSCCPTCHGGSIF